MKVVASRPFDFSYRGEMFVAAKGDAIEMPMCLVDKLAGSGLFDLVPQPMLMLANEASLLETTPVVISPAAAISTDAAEPMAGGPAQAPFRRGKRR